MKLDTKKQGILFIIMAGFFFALMTFFVRLSGDLPTMQKAFFRNAVAAVVAFAMIKKEKQSIKVDKSCWLDLFMRCFCGGTGLICNFYAIDRMNIADANILNKLSPFFAIVFSYILLKEKANKIEWLCVLVAFSGAIFIVKPSMHVEFLYALVGVYGGLGAGVAYTFVRKLGGKGVKSAVIVFFFSMFSSAITLPFFILRFHPMSIAQWGCLLLAGCCATGGQFCITTAYTKAPAKEISVFDYFQVLFAAMLGFCFLGEIPDVFSVIGYSLIIGSAIVKWIYVNKRTD